MNRFIGLVTGLLLLNGSVQAQKYITAAGLRIDKEAFGLTIQQRILPKSTLEGIGLIGKREVSGTVLFEQHFPIISNGFNYYIGAGGHVGNLKDYGNFYGADAIMGLEMKIPILPVNISLDLKPAFHVNHEDWFAFQGGFSIRTILIKQKKKEFKLFKKEFWTGEAEESDNEKEKSGGLFGKKKKKKESKKFKLFGEKED